MTRDVFFYSISFNGNESQSEKKGGGVCGGWKKIDLNKIVYDNREYKDENIKRKYIAIQHS